ncbi:MAG: acyl carrier protein [Ruminococcaceae bacterium]|nr:acyl carrier protein [Oscillospiraceae bacterium]
MIMTIEKIKELVAEHLEIEVSEITDTTTFQDLDADSLDTVEILMEIEDEFGVEIKQGEIGATVKDLADYIDSKKN